MSYHDNQEPEAPEVSQIMGGESAQSLSDRIMHGQSPSLSTKIRVNRILDRLRGKGYPEDEIKKVKIPLDNAEKYL